MLEPPTGWQFVLERPGQRAVVTEVGAALRSWRAAGAGRPGGLPGRPPRGGPGGQGAALRSWRAAGAERLDGFPVGSPGDGQCGKVLAPDAHDGLLLWVNWRPVRRGADRVALAYVLHPQPGYPHTVGVEVEYALAPEGIDVALRARNLGDEPAPFEAGFHPCVLAGACGEPERDGDGGARLRAGDVALWADPAFARLRSGPGGAGAGGAGLGAGGGALWADPAFARLRSEPDPHGVRLVLETGDGPRALAPGEAFEGRWGLSAL